MIWGGEFGRTPTVELANPLIGNAKVNGRDHNHYGFSMWLAGGGVKGGITLRRHRRIRLQGGRKPGARPRPARHDPVAAGLRPRAVHLSLCRPRLPPDRRARPRGARVDRLSCASAMPASIVTASSRARMACGEIWTPSKTPLSFRARATDSIVRIDRIGRLCTRGFAHEPAGAVVDARGARFHDDRLLHLVLRPACRMAGCGITPSEIAIGRARRPRKTTPPGPTTPATLPPPPGVSS